MSTELDKFVKIVKEINLEENSIAIFTHSVPDPDALSSAWGIKWILKELLDIDADIVVDGELSHPQNLTMQNLLKIPMIKLSDYEHKKTLKVIVVDTVSDNVVLPKGTTKPIYVIDHHSNPETKCKDVYIEQIGSCATIIVNWIREIIKLKLTTNKEYEFNEEDLSTCLYLGIRTDTDELLSPGTTEKDWIAYQFLSDKIDKDKFSKILNYPLPKYYLEMERIVSDENNHFIQDSYFVGGAGIATFKKKDCLAMLADKMIRIEGIETTIIFAIIENTLYVSIRTINSSIDAGTFAKDLYGKDFAGGRMGSAGAKVPLTALEVKDPKLQEEIWNCIKNSQFSKIRSKISGG